MSRRTELSIQDIPSIRSTAALLRTFRIVKRGWPILRSMLNLIGVDTAEMEKDLADLEEAQKEAEALLPLPDRFAELFAKRGWVMYDSMSVEAARAAVELADEGDIDGAERLLTEHYSPENIRATLFTLNRIVAFRPRMPLAKKALDDYIGGRYHSCVPVVLALLDGLVGDVHPQQRSFFAEGTTLRAWDSIAGHPKGLEALARVMNKGRRRTRSGTITVPYRHGIIHGRDLGYDNVMVAAKSWAALFAVADWAERVEQGRLSEPPKGDSLGLYGMIRGIDEARKDRARLSAWEPRQIQVGEDIPAGGLPDLYDEDTPERKLAEYLTAWQQHNYGRMAACLSSDADSLNKRAGAVSRRFEFRHLRSFKFTDLVDRAPSLTIIHVELVYELWDKEVFQSQKYHLLYLGPDGNRMLRGDPGGRWIVDD